jgi:mRNA-degrading endonuclease HigB of HigAB toxin-antitoxin module
MNPILNKKAQASAVPIVIIAIAFLILLYIVFLPKSEKCKILPDLEQCNRTDSGSTYSGAGTEASKIFLSENPGLLEPIEESAEYSFGTINLFNREVTEIPLKLLSDPSAEREWFYSKPYEIKFTTPGNSKELIIFVELYSIPSPEISRLSVYLNGKKIASLKNKGLNTIYVPNNLVQKENQLKFVASVPLSLFRKNVYQISSIIVKQTYSLTQGQIIKNLNIENPDSITSAILEFDSDCYSDDLLTISINNRDIVNEKICGEYSQEVRNFLNATNKITFSTDGSYFLTDVKLKVKNKQADYITYFFSVDEENYNALKDGKKLVFAHLTFGDANNKLVLYINGNPYRIDTTQTDFKTGAIAKLLIKGQNSLRIVPETRVNLGFLELYAE